MGHFFFFKMDIFFDLITYVLEKKPSLPTIHFIPLFPVINRESHE